MSCNIHEWILVNVIEVMEVEYNKDINMSDIEKMKNNFTVINAKLPFYKFKENRYIIKCNKCLKERSVNKITKNEMLKYNLLSIIKEGEV